MSKKNPRVDAYIEKAPEFAKPILKRLRQIVHAGCPEVEEDIKWSHASFMYKGMLCGMAAFKNHCTFGFWKHELLFPKSNSASKEEEAMGQFGRLTSVEQIPSEAVLLRYLKKAAQLNDQGVKVPSRAKPKVRKELVVPDYFLAAVKKNGKALKTFEAFSYSHKKEYVEWVTGAKRDETRERRLETAVAWMAQGKPQHWKYMNC